MTIVPRSISPLAVIVINRASTIAIVSALADVAKARAARASKRRVIARSEEHTSELQSLMRLTYAVFCLKKQNCTNSSTIAQQYTHMYTHMYPPQHYHQS